MRWFWRREEEEANDRPRVRVFDFDTQSVSTIPAAELAPGMLCVTIHGIEGEVWVDGSRLQMHAPQHPPFSEEVRDRLREIQGALGEVYPLSLEEWEDGFRRDTTPEREIAHWVHLAQVYSRFTAPDAGAMPIEKKQAIFKVLVGCGLSPRAQVLSVVEQDGALSRQEAEAVVNAFFGDSE